MLASVAMFHNCMCTWTTLRHSTQAIGHVGPSTSMQLDLLGLDSML